MERFDDSDDSDDEPDLETREERAAAAEARAIGGVAGPDGLAGTGEEVDEALRPVYEAGGGEAEGFELAELDLERNATHSDGGAYPERDAFSAERESDLAGAEYGEADEEESPDR
jgi:hypothetical protein